ncbi:MAG: hypothetical protein QOI15_661 [Pseudonocardiales bacterium]|jgi:hypothetical protein|nr:hypothetical protein [Pseudonocardiales bacterium]MDT4919759.1 hypothetical protein [Pseudonocardiales bacterium]
MSTPDEPTAETPATPATAAAEPAAVPAGPPPANPFVPTYREPWVNPARRRQAAGVAAIAVLVALGAGIGIGLAISGHGEHRDGPRNGVFVVPGRLGYGPGMDGPRGQIGGYPVGRPGFQPGEGTVVPATPAPSPSSTG